MIQEDKPSTLGESIRKEIARWQLAKIECNCHCEALRANTCYQVKHNSHSTINKCMCKCHPR